MQTAEEKMSLDSELVKESREVQRLQALLQHQARQMAALELKHSGQQETSIVQAPKVCSPPNCQQGLFA